MGVISLGKTLSLVRRLTDPRVSTEAIITTPPQKPAFKEKSRRIPKEYCLPEQAGVSCDLIAEYARALYDNKSIGIHSVMILRHGKVLFECGYDCRSIDIWQNTFSECKSIISIAIGILVTEGKLSTDTGLCEIFSTDMSPINRLRFKDVTVEHLLTMSSQVIFNEAECMAVTNWVKAFFASSAYSEMGTGFNYNSLNTYILAAAIVKLTGKSVSRFLDEKLFSPLDITNYFWEKCPRGVEKGGWGLYIMPYDLAKLGQLLLCDGVYNGHRYLSYDYVRRATTARVAAPKNIGNYDYGYQIWTCRTGDSFLFNGMLGQNMLCYRNNGIVVVSNAGNTDTFQQNDFFKLTDKYFAADMPDTLPAGKGAYRRLTRTAGELSAYTPRRHRHLMDRILRHRNIRVNCSRIAGEYKVTSREGVSVGLTPALMQVIQNNYTKGTVGYRFRYDDRGLHLDYEETNSILTLDIGFDAPCINDIEPLGERCRVAVVGEFRYNEDDLLVLKVRVEFLEYPYTRMMKFIFDGDALEVRYNENPSKEILCGFDMQDVMKNIPPWLSHFAAPEAQEILERLLDAFEPTLKAEKIK